MNKSSELADRLTELVRRRNRELAFDAMLKAGLGVVFSCITFSMLYWFAWFLGLFLARSLYLDPWQFGAIFTGVFLVVATWSAWRRVDPLAGLKPLTDGELLLHLLGHAVGVVVFSPRHASAGFAVVLIGGPANVIEAFGIWAHRLRAEAPFLADAAKLLAACETGFPMEQVHAPAVALLLKRLALIKAVPRNDSADLKLTDKGLEMLSRGKKTKPSREN